DMDETTSPVEANLEWIIAKDHAGYIGADKIAGHLQNGVVRKRVGICLLDKGIAREGAELREETDRKRGILTSGSSWPSVKKSTGQGYVETAFATPEQKIFVNVRGNNIAAEITPFPFLPARTKSMKKSPEKG